METWGKRISSVLYEEMHALSEASLSLFSVLVSSNSSYNRCLGGTAADCYSRPFASTRLISVNITLDGSGTKTFCPERQ
jgi:hypothetical protein